MRTSGHHLPKTLSIPVCLAILFLFAMALPPWAESARLVDFPVTVKQLDGTTLHLYVSGDEHYNWLHDKDGYTIIPDPVTGYYVYAVLDPYGDLVSSGLTVGSIHPATAGLEKGLKHAPEKIQEQVQKGRFLLQESLLEGREPLFAPKTGTINNLAVFIRFSEEAEFTDTIDVYETVFNNAAAGANSVTNYFREISYDQLSISTTFYPIPDLGKVRSYQDSQPRAYYLPYNAATNPSGYQNAAELNARQSTLLKNAVEAIASLVPSSINVDEDNDGNVDNICFMVYGAPDNGGNLLWPKQGVLNTNTYLYDRRVWTFNMQFQATTVAASGVGTIAHEMLHSIGFPDLYHSTAGLRPAAQWDIMEDHRNAPHPLAYMKHRYGGWIDAIPTIATPGTYVLNPLISPTNNAYRINSPYRSDQYFLVEYRRRVGTFEGALPAEGLLVYRINRVRAGQGNLSGPPDEVYVYRPGGTPLTDGTPQNAPFSSNSGRTRIHDSTDPDSFLSVWEPGGLFIYDISAIGANISFRVAFPPFVAQTGQTQSYAKGDDGELQSGIAWPDPRFSDAAGCIQDNLTGLVWAKTGSNGWQSRWWGEAIDYAKNLAWCGCSSWRVPNINELESVLNIGSPTPNKWLEGYFSDIGAATFWSSTARAADVGTANPTAWTHEFYYGKMAWAMKGTWDYTWPVCGGETESPARLLQTGQTSVDRPGDDGTFQAGRPLPLVRFTVVFCDDVAQCPSQDTDCDNNTWNDLVIDGATGLIWTRYASSIGLPAPCNKSIFKNWQNALDYVKCLNDNDYLGFNDWRLPNKNELRSHIDYSRKSPAIENGHPFISTGGSYWTSNTVGTTGYQSNAVLVDLTHGQTTWALKTNSTAGYGVWPVRTAKTKVTSAILTVTREGPVRGTVTSYPAGINCGPTCTNIFDTGQAVTLSAAAPKGSVFTGWSGCDSLTGNNCNVTMNDDRGVTAKFAVINLLLTVNKLGQGSGTVTSTPFGIACGTDCSEFYTGGAVVALTAAADSGSAFLQWSGCDSTDGTTCTVTMTSNKLVGANFVPLRTLTAAKSGDGTGTVNSTPAGIACGADCTERYAEGTVVTLTASPAEGSVFTGWWGGGCSGTGTCTVTMNRDTTVTADFTPAFTLTVTRQGAGSGTVAGDPAGINCGTECSFAYITGVRVTLTATPAKNSVFAGWTGCDNASDYTCTVTMVTDKFVYASFAPAPNIRSLTVTKSGSGKGTVTSNPSGISCGSDCKETYSSGTSVTLTASPSSGSTFTGWSGGGCSGTDPCTVTMTSSRTVKATFALIPCTYSLAPASKAYTAAGGSVTLTITGKGRKACPRPVVNNPYPWLTATTPTWANNTGKVKLTASANSSSVERSGTVAIGGTSFPVTQAGLACAIKSLTLGPSSYPKQGQIGMLGVRVAPQDCAWTVSASTDWMHLFSESGTGNGIIPVVVDQNPDAASRAGTVSAILSLPPNKKKTVTVTQEGS